MLRFSVDARRVAVFDRVTGNYRTDVPRNVAVEAEFNTVTTTTGEKDRAAEGRLAELDSAAPACFDKLERGEVLTREERWCVSFFVGFAETRGRAFRDAVKAEMPAEPVPRVGFVDDKFAEAFSAMVGVILDPRTIENIVLAHIDKLDPLTSGAYAIGAMVESAFLLARYCFWSDWLVASAPPDTEYITSDRPVGLLFSGRTGFGSDPLDPSVIKVLPLSGRNALVMRYSQNETAPVTGTVVTLSGCSAMNVAVARRCHRYVIGGTQQSIRDVVSLFPSGRPNNQRRPN